MALEINSNNFDKEISEGLVLVDFWATWCGPCKMLSPIINELSDEFQGKVKICKYDVDSARDIPERYNIMSVPTLILFKNGEILSQKLGLSSKQILKDWIQSNI